MFAMMRGICNIVVEFIGGYLVVLMQKICSRWSNKSYIVHLGCVCMRLYVLQLPAAMGAGDVGAIKGWGRQVRKRDTYMYIYICTKNKREIHTCIIFLLIKEL